MVCDAFLVLFYCLALLHLIALQYSLSNNVYEAQFLLTLCVLAVNMLVLLIASTLCNHFITPSISYKGLSIGGHDYLAWWLKGVK